MLFAKFRYSEGLWHHRNSFITGAITVTTHLEQGFSRVRVLSGLQELFRGLVDFSKF